MKNSIAFFAMVCLLIMTPPVAAAQSGDQSALPSRVVKPAVLESKIAEVQAALTRTGVEASKQTRSYAYKQGGYKPNGQWLYRSGSIDGSKVQCPTTLDFGPEGSH